MRALPETSKAGRTYVAHALVSAGLAMQWFCLLWLVIMAGSLVYPVSFPWHPKSLPPHRSTLFLVGLVVVFVGMGVFRLAGSTVPRVYVLLQAGVVVLAALGLGLILGGPREHRPASTDRSAKENPFVVEWASWRGRSSARGGNGRRRGLTPHRTGPPAAAVEFEIVRRRWQSQRTRKG
jgi:hypothetical protein